MIKYLRGQMSRPIVLWVLFLMLLLFLIAKPGISFSESASPGFTRFGLLKIDAKSRNAVFVTERRFRVTEKTSIVDIYGKNIELADLPIPCLAEVKYRLIMDQDPLTLKVVVKEVYPESSTVFVPRK